MATTKKNMSLINCIKTKQHFIIGLSFAFEPLQFS
jgi:hypothetical protein